MDTTPGPMPLFLPPQNRAQEAVARTQGIRPAMSGGDTIPLDPAENYGATSLQTLQLPNLQARMDGGPPQAMEQPYRSTRVAPAPESPQDRFSHAVVTRETARDQAHREVGDTQPMSWLGRDTGGVAHRSRLADLGLGALMGVLNGGPMGAIAGAAAGATGQLYKQGMRQAYNRRQGEIEHDEQYDQSSRLGEAKIMDAMADEAARRQQRDLYEAQTNNERIQPQLKQREQDLRFSGGKYKVDADNATERYKAMIHGAGGPGSMSPEQEDQLFNQRMGQLFGRSPIPGVQQHGKDGPLTFSTDALDQQIAGLEQQLAISGADPVGEDADIAALLGSNSNSYTPEQKAILRQIQDLKGRKTQSLQMWQHMQNEAAGWARQGGK